MKKRSLKNKITAAFASETPSLQSKILASCEKEAQLPASVPAEKVIQSPASRPQFNMMLKRVAACAVCLMLFLSGLGVGLFVPRGEVATLGDAETFVYLDVNPSIELQMDNQNRVVKCLAKNEDAEAILASLKLESVDMDTALSAIVGSMYVNGYLTEDSNSILISVDAKNDEKTNTLLSDITGKINTVFQNTGMECSIIAQSVKVSEELKQRAEDNGVSVGKMYLVDKMVEDMDDYDEEDAPDFADMSIKELNLIYSTRPKKEDEGDAFDKDVSSGSVGGFVKQDEALDLLLAAINVSEDDVRWYLVRAAYQRENGERKMVYKVSLWLKDTILPYEFEVDCKTGEVVKADSNLPNFNPSGENGEGSQPSQNPEEDENDRQHGQGSDGNGGTQSSPSHDNNEGFPWEDDDEHWQDPNGEGHHGDSDFN
ncbi:MAG: hypothetical protein J6K61_06160 [Clostridia bacterium]|nr:hypothetical protein [Clostridia bacterium]